MCPRFIPIGTLYLSKDQSTYVRIEGAVLPGLRFYPAVMITNGENPEHCFVDPEGELFVHEFSEVESYASMCIS